MNHRRTPSLCTFLRCKALQLWARGQDWQSRSPTALLATRIPQTQDDFPHGAPGEGSDSDRPLGGTAAAGAEPSRRPRGQRETEPGPGQAGTEWPGVHRPTLRGAGPLPRTWRRPGRGWGGASTHQLRTSASWSGSSGPWRRPRPAAAAAAAATAPRAPAATAPRSCAPRTLPPCSAKLRPAPRAVSSRRYPRSAPAPTPGRGHLLGPAAAAPCAPLPAPPRPLPQAAPSARRGRLRAPTRGRPASPAGPPRTPRSPRPGLAPPCALPGSSSPAQTGVQFFSFWCFAFFPAFPNQTKPLGSRGAGSPRRVSGGLRWRRRAPPGGAAEDAGSAPTARAGASGGTRMSE